MLKLFGVDRDIRQIKSLEEWNAIDQVVRGLFALQAAYEGKDATKPVIPAKPYELTDCILGVMETAHGGLTQRQILQRVRNNGWNFGAVTQQTKYQQIVRVLARRHDLFVKIGRGTWILAKYHQVASSLEEVPTVAETPAVLR